MFNVPPNPSVFSWPQAYWCGGVSKMAYCDVPTEPLKLKDSYNVTSVQLFLNTTITQNRVIRIETPDLVYFGIEGTARPEQWASYLGRIFLIPRTDWPGRFPEFFSTCADEAYEKVVSQPHGGKPLVLCGHSLGGAVAAIVAEKLKRAGYRIAALWTFGAPHPGTAEFAASITFPAYRGFGSNDVVPSLPPNGYQYAYPAIPGTVSTYIAGDVLAHVGEPIEIGDLDLSEVALAGLAEAQEVSWYRAAEGLAGHYMGSYQEAMWVRLTPQERGRLQAMFDILVTLQGQGIPDFVLDVATPEEDPELVNAAESSETDFLATITGDGAILTLRLFDLPETVPQGATVGTFTESSFPGYSRQRIPPTTLIELGKAGGTKTSPATVEFTLTADMPTPAEPRGVYAVIEDDGERLVQAYAFPAVPALAKAGDKIPVVAQCQAARVY